MNISARPRWEVFFRVPRAVCFRVRVSQFCHLQPLQGGTVTLILRCVFVSQPDFLTPFFTTEFF